MPCILFVDDDSLTLEAYDKIFSLCGYKVLLAESGQVALKVVKDHSIDLIVLDMRLPEMDGLEILRYLKSNPISSEIPVVIVTANPESIAQKALEAGAQYYLIKPINPDKVREILHQND
jgi:CheY-like chemotaxis protein